MTDLESLEERIARLEKMVEERHYIPRSTPWEVPYSLAKTQKCTKCGISIDKVIGYSCPRSDCPCGMGPVTC